MRERGGGYADDTDPAFVASLSSVSAINEVINVSTYNKDVDLNNSSDSNGLSYIGFFLLWIVWFCLVFLFASFIMDRK